MSFSELCRIEPEGIYVAPYEVFLETEREDFKSIYGEDIQIESTQPDGRRIDINALAKFEAAMTLQNIVKQLSIRNASGAPLTNLALLVPAERQSATYSQAVVRIGGTAGTNIIDGVVIDTNNNKWDLPSLVIIPDTGFVLVTCQAQELGSIFAGVNEINRIFTPTNGWQTVTNLSAALVGQKLESEGEFRARIKSSNAIKAVSLLEATKAAIENLDGVSRSEVYENDTNLPDADGLPPHSITAVVEGGNDQEIADTIREKKGIGGYTNGDIAIISYDSKGTPNTIRFSRPINVQVVSAIVVRRLDGFVVEALDIIAQAVNEYINGLGIGKDIKAANMFSIVALFNTPYFGTFDIESVLVGISPAVPSETLIDIGYNEVGTSTVPNISVTVV